MSEILLIEIGGTNIRYAYSDGNLETLTGTNKIKLSWIKGFDNILEDLTDQKEISSLVITVAGPKINGSIAMTNRDFTINEAELKNKFQFELIELVYLRLGYAMMLEWGWDKFQSYDPADRWQRPGLSRALMWTMEP